MARAFKHSSHLTYVQHGWTTAQLFAVDGKIFHGGAHVLHSVGFWPPSVPVTTQHLQQHPHPHPHTYWQSHSAHQYGTAAASCWHVSATQMHGVIAAVWWNCECIFGPGLRVSQPPCPNIQVWVCFSGLHTASGSDAMSHMHVCNESCTAETACHFGL